MYEYTSKGDHSDRNFLPSHRGTNLKKNFLLKGLVLKKRICSQREKGLLLKKKCCMREGTTFKEKNLLSERGERGATFK